jgi:hypothetical protein
MLSSERSSTLAPPYLLSMICNRFLLLALHKPELRAVSSAGLISLSALDYDTRATGVGGIIARQTPSFLTEMAASRTIEDPSSSEFKLLELFILSPWFAIQSDISLFAKALEYLVWVLTQLTKSGSSSSASLLLSESSADPASDLLLRYDQLLYAALQPVFTPSVPLSIYFSELFPPPPPPPPPNQDHLSTRHCLRPNQLDQTQPLVLQALRLHISSHKWIESTVLQVMRLDMLSLLLCQRWREDESGTEGMPLDFVREQISGVLSDLLTQVIPSASSPTTPLIVRQRAIDLLAFALRCCCPEIRIVPYASRDSTIVSASWITAPGDVDIVLDHLTSVCLNDSSDEIRLPALEILLQLIPFVRRESTDHPSSSSSQAKHTHFDGLIDCLLGHSVHGNPTEDILTHLDLVLRSVAILDPISFESLVRARFSSITAAEKAPNSVAEFFSGLIDHAGLLTQFQQSRRSDQTTTPLLSE